MLVGRVWMERDKGQWIEYLKLKVEGKNNWAYFYVRSIYKNCYEYE
jgi:hypothetical protein